MNPLAPQFGCPAKRNTRRSSSAVVLKLADHGEFAALSALYKSRFPLWKLYC